MSGRSTAGERVPPDQIERNKITEELNTNILVEAAAGTGKTASMLDRIVALLRTGKCENIATLAAVTFTRKAASELRTRFQVALEREAAAAEGVDRERLARALANIDQCFIGTIHSFCGRLLRERPVEARVDLAFREIEPAEDARMRRQAWDEYAARLIAGGSPEILESMRELGMTIADLEETFVRFADFPDVDEWPVPGPGVEVPAPGKYIKALYDYAARMRKSLPLPADPQPPTGARRMVDEFVRLPRLIAFSDLKDTPVLISVLKQFNAGSPNMSTAVQKEGYGKWYKGEREVWNDFREQFAKPYLDAVGLIRYRLSITAMTAAREIYDDLRLRQGKLNFQDLLMKSAALLKDKPHVRAYFARRFTHLLVDEFQDTDPIQAQVMLYLTATDYGERDWKKCRPRPGSLFVVGDPKQSIYRFRRADIVTYNDVKRIIRESGGQVIELSANFRATEDLIEWTNDAFVTAFPAEATDHSPAYVELQPGRDEVTGQGLNGVRVLIVPAAMCTKEAGASGLEYEADVIARTIRGAIDSGTLIERAGEKVPSPATPGDFMVICYNKSQLSSYARKLQQSGVPHRVSGGKALNEVWELRLLHSCLNAVTQPDNPVALVAALRSELLGVSDAALYAFKKAGGRFSYNFAVPEELDPVHTRPIALAFSRLKEYSLWLQKMPAVSAIEQIIADSGLMVLAASREGGDVQAGSVAKAIELLRSVQEEMPTTARLVEYLGELVDTEAESEDFDGISAVPTRSEVVQVMNLHKAKGLQAPVVFLAGHKTSSSGTISSYVDRSAERVAGYLAITTKKGQATITHATPADWESLKAAEKLFQDAEKTRLVYVAVTRAESMLVVTRQDDGKAKCIWSALAPELAAACALEEPCDADYGPRERGKVTTAMVRDAHDTIEERLRSVEGQTFAVRAAKEYALSGDFDTGEGTLMSFGEPLPGTSARVPDGEHGVEWGGAVHELLDFAMKYPDADLEAVGRDALAEADLDPARLGDLVETVRSVVASQIWERARGSSRCMTEVPFDTMLGDAAGLPTLVRGSIDLAFKEDDGWVIVDYKTDAVPAGGDFTPLAEHYAPQVRLYTRAFEECTGQKVKETALYFVRADRLITV